MTTIAGFLLFVFLLIQTLVVSLFVELLQTCKIDKFAVKFAFTLVLA